MCAMFGWFNAASVLASCSNRISLSGSAENSSGRILSATTRSSRVSRARLTAPIPPAPSGASTSYTPTRDPAVNAIDAGIIWRGRDWRRAVLQRSGDEVVVFGADDFDVEERARPDG